MTDGMRKLYAHTHKHGTIERLAHFAELHHYRYCGVATLGEQIVGTHWARTEAECRKELGKLGNNIVISIYGAVL